MLNCFYGLVLTLKPSDGVNNFPYLSVGYPFFDKKVGFFSAIQLPVVFIGIILVCTP